MLNKIKSSCKYVADNSKYVKINYDKVDKFINNIDCSKLKNWLIYNPYGLLDLDVETIINFLLIFESIDYSFWGQPKWTINTDEGSKNGSDALLYVMLKYVKETKNTDFSNISISELKKILISNVEIRASQIVVIEYIHSKLINISPIDINDFFFVYSKKIKSIAKPYHLCRNTNY